MVFIGKNPLLGGRRCVTEMVEVAGRAGRPGRAVRRIFAPSPVDGRAVRVAGRGDQRGPAEELADAGYDDTAAGLRLPATVPADGAAVTGSVLLAVLLGAGDRRRGAAADRRGPRDDGGPDPAAVPGRPARLAALRSPAVAARVAGAAAVGAAVLVLTRWPVAAAGAGGAGDAVAARCSAAARAEQRQIASLEALVVWTESLRDTIAAHASLEQAIPATDGERAAADPAGAGPAGRADPGAGADGPGAAAPGRGAGRPVGGPGDRRADPERPAPR